MDSTYAVDRLKWSKLSIFQQMGNIYSEVGRTFSAKQRNDSDGSQAAFVRALDLFDASSEGLTKQRSPKLRELLRVREIYVDEFLVSDTTTLDSYFMPFAIAARLQS